MTTTSEKMMILNQFPEPARPSNSYDTSFQIQSTTYPQEQSIHQSYVEKEGEGKLALVDKLVNRVLDKCVKHLDSQSTTSRDPHHHPVKDKLQRFKIRTVLTEEVVKEEEEKK